MGTVKGQLCGGVRMMVDCFSFGEVHWVTCVQSVLCEG